MRLEGLLINIQLDHSLAFGEYAFDSFLELEMLRKGMGDLALDHH